MNSIRNLSIIFSAVIVTMTLAALVLRDPLVRKCESIKIELSVIAREDPHRPALPDCKRMLREAERNIERANKLKADMRRVINQPTLSHVHGREVERLRLRSAALRDRADSLLEEARLTMHRLPPAL
jgi:hypothetical protein